MKKDKDIKNLDEFFKQHLADPVDKAEFREDDWDALEQMLGKKRRGVVFWLPYISSAAAVLLVFFGWLMFKPHGTDHAQKPQQQVAVNHTQQTTVDKTQKTQQPTVISNTQKSQQQAVTTNQPKENNANTLATTNKHDKAVTKQVQPGYLADNTNKVAGGHNIKNSTLPGERPDLAQNGRAGIDTVSGRNDIYNIRDHAMLTAVSREPDMTLTTIGMPALASINILPKTTAGSTSADAAKTGKKAAGVKGLSFHPQYTLSVLASSELNGVGTFQQGSSGTNVGLLFSAGYKKFSITTGATYSLKPYTLPFDEYHTTYKFKNAPESVSADCRVLDIPINIDYQVYNKARNKISVGTGLSSYIMMHESYTYDYGSSDVLYGPSYYAVKTRGKYMFSIMNIEATYQRQVNSKVGISIQPYLKVPLSDIGYSQIKVQTFGVAVGLNWNINPLKPK
jgi:hypothetical protein